MRRNIEALFGPSQKVKELGCYDRFKVCLVCSDLPGDVRIASNLDDFTYIAILRLNEGEACVFVN